MNGFMEILSVAGLFFLRIGLPLLVLLAVGSIIERAYRRREAEDNERPIAVDLPMHETQDEEVEQEVEYVEARHYTDDQR